MSVMAFYIYFGVAGLGVVGAMVLVGRYISGARSLSGEDQKKWLDRLPPFFTFLSDAWQRHVRPPSVRFWNAHIHSVFLGEGERWSRRFRIVALRIENVFRFRHMRPRNASLFFAQNFSKIFWRYSAKTANREMI